MQSKRWIAAALWLAGHAANVAAQDSTAFEDYVNGRPPGAAKRVEAGVYLGLTDTPDDASRFRDLLRSGEFVNPLSGAPFDDVEVHGFAWSDNVALDAPRVVANSLGAATHGPSEPRYYDYLFCHSDGCTTALEDLRAGRVKAGVVIAFGTEWTDRPDLEEYLGEAELFLFEIPGDPVSGFVSPTVGRLELVRASETAPGIGVSKLFGPGSGKQRVFGPYKLELTDTERADIHWLGRHAKTLYFMLFGRGGLEALPVELRRHAARARTRATAPEIDDADSSADGGEEPRAAAPPDCPDCGGPPKGPPPPPPPTPDGGDSGQDRGGIDIRIPIDESAFGEE